MVVYYSSQCPYTEKYVPVIAKAARQHGTKLNVHKIETGRQAQNAPSPFPTYSFFCDGELVTNEIFSEKKFEKFLQAHGF